MLVIEIALDLISLIGIILLIGMCLFMLFILLRSSRNSSDTVLILMAHNYLAILGFAITTVSSNIDAIYADFSVYTVYQTLICRIKGYIICSISAIIFYIFALQATFRFFRVAYPSYVWLQYCRTYTVIILILWIISFLFLLPIHIWHDISLIPDEKTCLLNIDTIRGVFWATVVIYCFPMTIIGIIYSSMVRCMYRPSMGMSTRAKRDLIVTRRIVLVGCILTVLYIPMIIIELILLFTTDGRSIFYRVINIILVVVMNTLSFMLIYISPQVKQIILRCGKQNQVTFPYSK